MKFLIRKTVHYSPREFAGIPRDIRKGKPPPISGELKSDAKYRRKVTYGTLSQKGPPPPVAKSLTRC